MQHIDIIKLYQSKFCLIVEDLPEARASLKSMINTFGLEHVDTAATSEQAIELCETRQYDLVLCDYNLGEGQDGQQLLEELRHRKLLRNASMFVMVTAESSRDMVLGALEYQPDDYLTKPVTQSLVQQRLTRFILRHEDLLPIKRAIDDNDLNQALKISNDKLQEKGQYPGSYTKVKGELLVKLNHLGEAKQLYESILQDRPLPWAQLGLAKILLKLKKHEQAESLLLHIIDKEERYVEAHDLLSDLYEEQAEFEKAQEAMERAAYISPKSVLRQRRLATMSRKNGDQRLSLKARKAALKVGEHSCHHIAQDYFDIIDELLTDDSDPTTKSRQLRDCGMYIRRAEKKHSGQNLSIQAAAAKARLAQKQGNPEAAQTYLQQAKSLCDDNQDINPYAELELAQAMRACDESENATEILARLVKNNQDNNDLCMRIDAMCDEPISQMGKHIASNLNRKGIDFFETKAYDEALAVFVRASHLFPRHPGLRLNIVQVALDKYKAGESESTETAALIKSGLQAVRELSPEHEQYPRYQYLKKQALKLGDI